MSDSPKPDKKFLSGTSSKASGLSKERKPRGSPEMQYSFRPNRSPLESLNLLPTLKGFRRQERSSSSGIRYVINLYTRSHM